jgi:hypothetical protein
MQDNLIQPVFQPFFKLAQSNMALLTQFSPEVMSQAMGTARSNAVAELLQGLTKNYTEFLVELGQSSVAVLSQGQAAFLRQAQEASSNVIDATQARRARHAA